MKLILRKNKGVNTDTPTLIERSCVTFEQSNHGVILYHLADNNTKLTFDIIDGYKIDIIRTNIAHGQKPSDEKLSVLRAYMHAEYIEPLLNL